MTSLEGMPAEAEAGGLRGWRLGREPIGLNFPFPFLEEKALCSSVLPWGAKMHSPHVGSFQVPLVVVWIYFLVLPLFSHPTFP